MRHIKLFEQFNESSYLEKDYATDNLFNKYQRELEKDTDKYSNAGLKKSLELIGPGEITDKGDERFMYKEMMMDDKIIFVVHGSIGNPVMTNGYSYEIGVYRNDPKTQQIGGGYGTSGIVSINHTKIFGYDTYQKVYQNENIISKVCADIKKEIENGNIK